MLAPRVVLNEWLLHDIRGDDGPTGQLRAIEVIERLRAGGAVLCVMSPSPWLKKAYHIWLHTDPTVRDINKALWLSVLTDSNKTFWLISSEVSPAAKAAAELAPMSDRYLIETAISSAAQVVVTTDQPFIDLFARSTEVSVIHRDSYLGDP